MPAPKSVEAMVAEANCGRPDPEPEPVDIERLREQIGCKKLSPHQADLKLK